MERDRGTKRDRVTEKQRKRWERGTLRKTEGAIKRETER